MYQITNDHCDLCRLDLHDKIYDGIRRDKPAWFRASGQPRLNRLDAIDKRVEGEFFRNDCGPRMVWVVMCADCGTPTQFCAKHLREVLAELEKAEAA